jgi:hypothetical protein
VANNDDFLYYFFFVDLLGLSEGVLPGVFLLSLCRRSGFPVDFAVLFGPGLIASIFMWLIFYYKLL